MKRNKKNPLLVAMLSLAGLTLNLTTATAANRYWDGGTTNIAGNGNTASGGTAGTWNTTLTNWDAGAVPYVAWVNANNDTAIFAGTAGAVTLGVPITAGGLTFNHTTGTYTLQTGVLTLSAGAVIAATTGGCTASLATMTATDSIFRVDHASTTNNFANANVFTISSAISGANSVQILGNGASTAAPVYLSGATSYTGTTTVAANAALGFNTGAVTITDASITLNANSTLMRQGGSLTNAFLKKAAATTNTITIVANNASCGSALDFSGSNGGVSLPNASLAFWDNAGTVSFGFTGAITAGSNGYLFGSTRVGNQMNIGGTNGTGAVTNNILTSTAGLTLITGSLGNVALWGSNTFSGNTLNSATGKTISINNALALQNSAIDTSGVGTYVLGTGSSGTGGPGAVAIATPTIGGLIGSKNLQTTLFAATGYNLLTSLTLNPGTGKNHNYTGVIANSTTGLSLTKNGLGTQALGGANTFAGATAVIAGTLQLDYTTQDNSKLSDTAALVLGGGTLDLKAGMHTEVVLSTTLTAGTASSVTSSTLGAVLQMGAITRGAGASVNFGTDNIATTNTLNTNGILGIWATVGGVSFAANSSNAANGAIIAYAYSGAEDVPRLTPGTIVNGASSNVRLVEGTGTAGDILLGSATTAINTLNQSNSGGTSAATIDPAGQTLLTNAILVGTGAGALTIGNGTNNGTLGAGAAGGELTLNNISANPFTVNSTIADNASASSLVKSGSGLVTLAGINTYSGLTTIATGTLQISGAGALGSGTHVGAIANSGILQYSSSAAQTLSGVISGTGTLVKDTSNSVLTLTGVNTFTGGITMADNAGTIDVNGAGSLGSGTYAQPIALGTGSALKFSSNILLGTQTLSGAITGMGGVTMAPSVANANLTLSNAGNTYSGVTAISGGRLQVSPVTGALSPNTSFAITGNTTSGGQLFISAAGTVINNLSIAGTGYIEADGITRGGAIRFGGSTSVTGSITLTGDARVGYVGNANFSSTLSGQITGSNGIEFFAGLNASNISLAVSLANAGTPNDYTGNTTISCADFGAAKTGGVGLLSLGLSDQIPNGTGKGNLVFTGADANHLTVLEMNGKNETINGLSNVAAAGAIIRNNFAGASVLTVGDADTTSSFSGAITNTTGTLALTKIGTGTLTLSSGASNFSGDILINDGTLVAAGSAGTGTAFGAASSARTISIASGKNLRFDIGNVLSGNFAQNNVPTLAIDSGATATNNFANNNALGNVTLTAATLTATAGSATYGAFNINGTITSTTGASLISTSDPINGKMMLTSAGANNVATRNIIDVMSNTLTISAPLAEVTRESKISGLTKTGSGTLLLTGANSYSGGTAISQGVLTVGTGGTLGATTGELIVSNPNTGTGTDVIVNLATAVDTTVGSLSGTIALPSGGTNTATINNGGVGSNFTVNQTSAGTFAGVIAGDGSFTLGGLSTNTLTITGTPTYTGTTTVNAGTLKLDYATNNTSKLADAVGLILGGGTIDLSGGSHTEAVASTTLSAGTASQVSSSTLGSTLQMNTITPGVGATINFSANNIATTDNTNTNGILGTWATVGGSDFAMNATNTADGLIIAYTGYSDVTRLDGTPALQIINDGSTNNVRIIEGAGAAANLTLGAATTTINSLNQSTIGGTSAATIDPAGQTLRVNTILAATGAGALTIGTGTLSTATAGGDLALNNSSANDFTVNAVIANNTSASSLSKTGAGVLVLSAANTYTGATVIGAGSVNLTGSIAGSAITVNGSAVFTESSTGVLSGASSLTVASTATSTLNGVNAHTGGTAVSAGNLILGNTAALGTGPFTLSGGNFNTDGSFTALASNNVQNWNAGFIFGGASDLDLGTGAVTLNANSQVTVNANKLTVGGAVSGGFGITKAGAGTLVLNGTNIHSGGTTLNGGTLVLGNASALGTGAFTINGGGTNTLDSSVANLVITPNNPQNWQASFTFTGTENLDLGTGAVTMLGNRTVTVANNTLTIGGAIGGGFNLTKAGTGAMILSGVSTYTGSTTINDGSLTVNGAGSLGSGSYAGGISLVSPGELFYSSSAAQTFSGIISGAGTLTQNGAGILTLTGNNTHTGTIVVTTTVALAPVGALTMGSIFTGAGTLSVTPGTNTLQLNGDLSGFTGTLNVAAPVASPGKVQTGTLGGVTVVNVASGGTWLTNAAQSGITVNLAGTGNAENAGALRMDIGSIDSSSSVVLLADSSIGGLTTTNTAEIGAVISQNVGPFALTKLGTNNIILSAANTYSGLTTVSAGSLILRNPDALGTTAAGTTVADTARVELDNITVTGEAITISGAGTNFLGALQGKTGTNVWTGNVTIAADGTRIGTAVDSSIEISGVIDDGLNDYRVMFRPADTAATPSTVFVTGANTYTGGTSIVGNGGPVVVSSINSVIGGSSSSNLGAPTTAANGLLIIGTGTVSGTLSYIGSGETTDRTVQIGANANPPVSGDSGGAGIQNNGTTGALVFSAPNFNTPTNALTGTSPTRLLTLGGSNTAANKISGIIQNNQIASSATAAVAITKNGSGSWVLEGANTYTGATRVSNGILSISGGNLTSGSMFPGDTAGQSGTLNITAGTYNLQGTAEIRVGQSPTAGSPTGTGTLNQSGGVVTFTNTAGGAQMVLGGNADNATASTAIYNLSGGSVTIPALVNRGILIGSTGNTTGSFVLSGTGVLNMTTASGGNGDANLFIGRPENALHTNITASFTQTGGTANIGNLSIGGSATFGPAGTQTLSLSGGTFSANVFSRLAAGNSNTAIVNIGGTAQVTLPAFPTTRGTTTTTTLTLDSTTGFLSPLVASAVYMPAGTFTNAYLTANGAKFNVGTGNDITVGQVLADAVSPAAVGTLTKDGVGTLTLTGANTYTGATTVSLGTLALVGGSQASPVTVSSGASLGFTLGSPTTSTSSFNLSAGTIKITGTPTLASYDLISSSTGITGTPVLDAPISGYELKVVGNTLVLKQAGYASWAATNAIGSTPDQDKDGDGVSNAVEYVLGGDVNTNDLSKLPAITPDATNMLFSFKRKRTSLDGSTTIVVEVGTGLDAWPSVYNVATTTALSSAGITVLEDSPTGFDTITLSVVKAPDPKKFGRLKVTVVP